MSEQIKNTIPEIDCNISTFSLSNLNATRQEEVKKVISGLTNQDTEEIESIDVATEPESYTVQPGDSLMKIAKETLGDANRYTEIVELNNIADPNNINVGMNLILPTDSTDSNISIPVPSTDASSSKVITETLDLTTEPKIETTPKTDTTSNTIYTVKGGDTLSAIANQYGLDYHELAKYNGIADPNNINIGQEIKIPQSSDLSATSNPVSSITDTTDTTEEKVKDTIKKDINPSAVKDGTNVKRALEKYADEIENSQYVTLTENTLITTNPITIEGSNCFITHIVVNDPSQLKKGMANGGYAKGRQTVSEFASEHEEGLIFINGSHFEYDTGAQDITVENNTNRIAIGNGEILETETTGIVNDSNKAAALQVTSGGNEFCIDKNGKMFRAQKGMTVEQLLDMGVVETYSSHEAPIIENGEIQTQYPSLMGDVKRRTVLCMTEPGEYYILTGETTAEAAGNYLKNEKGVTFAKSMDQGGSAGLVYREPDKLDVLYDGYEDGNHRPVGDFWYITD